MPSLKIDGFTYYMYYKFTYLLVVAGFQMFSTHSYRFLKEISTSSAYQVSISIKAFVLDGQINTDFVIYPHVLLQLL